MLERSTCGPEQSFYASAFDDAQRLDYELALDVQGLEGEIALMRTKVKSLVQKNPDNILVIMRAVGYLDRMIGTQLKVGKNNKRLESALAGIVAGPGLPPGFRHSEGTPIKPDPASGHAA